MAHYAKVVNGIVDKVIVAISETTIWFSCEVTTTLFGLLQPVIVKTNNYSLTEWIVFTELIEKNLSEKCV